MHSQCPSSSMQNPVMAKTNGSKHAAPRCILNIPFSQITNAPISLPNATKRRFRFLDGEGFAQHECLRVFEYESLPEGEYATLSYVWRGLDPVITDTADAQGHYIFVEGAKDADPISVEVLRLAAVAALFLGCKLVWLDVLCILQADPDDRAWQIQNMYDVYRLCKHCVAIPGGLMRLAAVTEETNWVHRAWTLQEAVAPPSVRFLFAWTQGTVKYQSNFTLEFTEVEPGVAAVADMTWLLPMAIKCSNAPHENALPHGPGGVPIIRLLGDTNRYSSLLVALMTAVDTKHWGTPGIAHAVWRSSFMRTARYPVDMVFSIMGILGVTLDTSKFAHDDRQGATIALMQALANKDGGGGQAEWLGIAPGVLPNPAISTLPVFPHTSPDGRALIETVEKQEEASAAISSWWQIENTPTGSVDDDGRLLFRGKSAYIVQVSGVDEHAKQVQEAGQGSGTFESVLGGKWMVCSQESPGLGYRAVHAGKRALSRNGAFPALIDPTSEMLLLLEDHGDGISHVVGYSFVPPEMVKEREWSEAEFRVGEIGGRSAG